MTTKSQSLDPVDVYLQELRDRPGANLQGAAEKAALERIQTYLSNLTEDNISRTTLDVYAPNAFFNDTLKTEHGAEQIRKYFLETAKNVDSITVEFEDVSRSGNDYYLRWVMDVEFKKFQRGTKFRTIGMTHIRFDGDGKVILHQDYWDSARGIFEQVPVLGSGIRWIRGMF